VALRDVDLQVGTGLFGLLGPNGAGKSTLMRILCTLIAPSQGQAFVGGFDVVRDRMKVREQLGYLPQEFGAWRSHRTEEVLDTLALLSGLTDRAQRRAKVAEVLRSVGLEEVAERKVKKLSGGMVRRLGVAQALIHEPRILVVDEPTVGLDPEERLRFRKLMASLGEERTIVLSTHIVADLGSGCRDLALLDGGRVIFRGSPTELLGRAADRIFEVTVERGREQEIEAGYEIVSRTVDGNTVTLRGVVGSGNSSRDVPEGARREPARSLEEGYLAFMATRGSDSSAGQEEVVR
jgi:ABC-type multidrug transport system ATPase subunit